MKTLLISCSLLFLFVYSVSASHIIGGEISYKHLSGDNYQLTVKIYRDCYNGIPPLDNPATFNFYDIGGNVIADVNIPLASDSILPVTTTNPCLLIPLNVCIEKGTYVFNQSLPHITGGYTIVYQICCRNASTINIYDPGDAGVSFFTAITDTSLLLHNSSPVFKNYPPMVICVHDPLVFDNSAYDENGDSLSYELSPSFEGPQSGTMPPPFQSAEYNRTYTYQNPIDGSPALAIDSNTGLLTVTPTEIGVYVVAVKVNEYRAGLFLGSYVRDFEFNVVSCSNTSVIPSFTALDSSATVTFNSSTSIGAISYQWDFGDGFSAATPNPVHTYSSNGIYSVCLTVANDKGCESKLCRNVAIGVPNTCSADFVLLPDTATPHYWFALNSSHGKSALSYLWQWGDGTVDTGATPSHVYASSGFYTICLTVSDDSGCTSTVCDSSAHLFRTDDTNSLIYVNAVTSLPNGVKTFPSANKTIHIYPNPCVNCEVRGVDDIHNITVTDLLGRRVCVSFTKTGDERYRINLPESASGIFILKNIRTGEVIKFVKE